jgi:hypothetical protein
MSTRKIPGPVSQLSRRCGSLDLSHPYGPSRPVTGIALLFYFLLSTYASEKPWNEKILIRIIFFHSFYPNLNR